MLRLAAMLVLAAMLLITAIIFGACLSFAMSIDADLQRLTDAARATPPSITAERLAALPLPAQRYFAHAGVGIGSSSPRLVRLTQTGRLRSSAESAWMTFEASQTYSTNPPAFVWRAWFPVLGLPIVLGRDEYLEGQGSIVMKMLALFPVADEHSDELRAAGLMRYLNEMMWFPAAFLGPNVTIEPVDDSSFSVTIEDRGLKADALMIVDADGRPVNFRARRYDTATRDLEIWETPLTGELSFADLALPSSGTAVWKLATGDLAYIELQIADVRYEN